MSGMPGIVKSITDDVLLHGFRTVASLGPDAVACVHCETGALIDGARKELAKKQTGTLADWEHAHPAVAEALAIQTALYLAKLAGAHLYVVHLSSHQGLEVVRAARRAGNHFTVETTTPYLGINSHDPNGFLVKMVPPVRTPEHQTALWEGLPAKARSTRSAPTTPRAAARRSDRKPDCMARVPACPRSARICRRLLHYGRLRGVPLEVLVDRATRSPAQVYGIYPQKGTIAVGSDADLVVVDLDLEKVVRAEDLQGMSDFSPFEGKTLRGWPVATIKAGQIIARDGKIVAKANGRYLFRKPAPARHFEWFGRGA